MSELFKLFGIIFILLTLIGSCVAWKVYEYKDCKKVGHSTFYCFMKMGKK